MRNLADSASDSECFIDNRNSQVLLYIPLRLLSILIAS